MATATARTKKRVGITPTAAKAFPWWLKYQGAIVAGSIFSSVLFDYVGKHESTKDKYEVVKNPAFAKNPAFTK